MGDVALRYLNPVFRGIYVNFTPETGGDQTDEYELTFRCPVCGPPMSVVIKIGPSIDQSRNVWQVTPPAPSAAYYWPDLMTISPSIGNESAGHGKHRPPCTFHGHIINGRVLFPGDTKDDLTEQGEK